MKDFDIRFVLPCGRASIDDRERRGSAPAVSVCTRWNGTDNSVRGEQRSSQKHHIPKGQHNDQSQESSSPQKLMVTKFHGLQSIAFAPVLRKQIGSLHYFHWRNRITKCQSIPPAVVGPESGAPTDWTDGFQNRAHSFPIGGAVHSSFGFSDPEPSVLKPDR